MDPRSNCGSMQSSHIPTLETDNGNSSNGPGDQVDSGKLLDLSARSTSSSSTNDFMMEDFETLYKYSHRGSGAVHKQTTLHSFISKRPRMSGIQDHTPCMVDTVRTHHKSHVIDSGSLSSSKLKFPQSLDTRGATGGTSSVVINSYECVEEMIVETKVATLSAKGTRKNGAQTRPRKLCPFYKKVPGTLQCIVMGNTYLECSDMFDLCFVCVCSMKGLTSLLMLSSMGQYQTAQATS